MLQNHDLLQNCSNKYKFVLENSREESVTSVHIDLATNYIIVKAYNFEYEELQQRVVYHATCRFQGGNALSHVNTV